MPLQEQSVMDLRQEFVALASQDGANMRELCRRYGISPTTGYRYVERWRQAGVAGLGDCSRRAPSPPSCAAVTGSCHPRAPGPCLAALHRGAPE